MSVSESTRNDSICYCILRAGRQRRRDTGAGSWPGRAIPVHAPAADQDAAIIVGTELSGNPRRGAAVASPEAVALGALPRHAAAGPFGFCIDTHRSYGPRPCDFRPVFSGRDVRRPRFELRTCWRVGWTGPQPVKRIHGPVCELTTDRMSKHNSPPNMSELQRHNTYVEAPIKRVKDLRFLRGRGCYLDDNSHPATALCWRSAGR